MGWRWSLLSLWCDCGELVAGTGTSRLLYLHFWVLEVGNLCGWDLYLSLHINILGFCIIWWLAVRAKVPRGQANSMQMQALIKPVSYWPQEILCLSPVSVWEGPTYQYTYQQGPVCQGPPMLTFYLNASYKTCEIWISNIISYTRCFVLKQCMFWVQHDDSSLCYVVTQFSTLFLISISGETSFSHLFGVKPSLLFLPACNQEALSPLHLHLFVNTIELPAQ